MIAVQTFAVVGEHLDDATLCDMSVTATFHHPF